MKPRLPRRLWTRLTVLFVGLFLLTIGGVVVLSLVIANRQFSSSVDDQIHGTATTAEERLADGAEPQRVLDELATSSQYLQLLDKDGLLAYRSYNMSRFTLPSYLQVGEQRTRDGYHNITRQGQLFRVIRHAQMDESGNITGYILVAGLVSGTTDSTLDLGLIVVPTAAFGLLAVAIGTVWLARREAAPLKHLADEVRSTAASGFQRPIPAEGQGSEEARELRHAISTLVDRQRDQLDRERAFFADSSHVLRTPLAVLKGDVELLEQGVYGKERQEAVTQARAAIDTMSRTVSGLLLLARDQDDVGSSWEVLELGELLHRVVAAATVAYPALGVTLDRPASGPELAGDANQLRDLFTSLVENACQYTPEGGSVTVAVMALGGDIEVAIRDTGIGFTDEELRQATERFFRGPQARRIHPGGSGLGLAIADRIVNLHKGSLTLGASEPQGAVVTVRLPALE